MLSFRHARFVLCLTLLVPASASAQTRSGSLSIRAEGQELVLSAAELMKLPRHEQTIASEGTSEPAKVSGVLLWDLLQLARVPSPTASGRQRAVMYVKLTGADGQSAVMALVEIDPSFSKRVVLVADRRNGQALNSVEGPWRVFIPDDIRHARWIRGLVTIEAVTIR